MSELLIVGAFAVVTVASFLQGRRFGARTMARSITNIAEEHFPNFKITIAKGMLKQLNESRERLGLKPVSTKFKEEL